MADIIDKDMELVVEHLKKRAAGSELQSTKEFNDLNSLINRLAAARVKHPYVPDDSITVTCGSNGKIIWSASTP